MSAALLTTPEKKHELADDLEAFIHTLRWTCLRFYDTGIELCHYVSSIFEAHKVVD